MSNLTMDQLRAAFKKTEKQTKLPNNYYPFWDMKVNESATVRFLPDKNTQNPLGFIIEKKQHTLMINGQKRKVACLDMYGEKCPICQVSRDYYKIDDKDNGKKYYRSVQYIAQAIIVENPLPTKEGEDDPVGKVRLLALGPQIYKIIKDSFESGELDELPYHFENGTDFVIKKDKQGEYSSYSLSKFSRRERALDEDTIANLKLTDLVTVLPKNPGLEKVTAMLEADMTGSSYVEEGTTADDVDDEASDQTPVNRAASSAVKAEARSEMKAPEKNDEGDAEADDALAKLRAELAARRKGG